MDNFSEILDNAKQISAMLDSMSGTDDSNNERSFGRSAENADTLNSFSHMINMIDAIKSLQSIGKKNNDIYRADAAPLNGFGPETAGIPNSIKVMTAVAPYMGEQNRRNIIVASKLMELMYIINSLDADGNPPESALYGQGEASPEVSVNSRNMLLAARPYVDCDKREMVDLLITVMDISEILKKMAQA